MCKNCWNDPGWDKIYYWRQGGVDVSDFDEEVRYRKPGKGYRRKVRYPKTRPGCPDNEYKAHVYVWTSEREEPDMFSTFYGWHKTERKICVGCGKSNGRRESERYLRIKERKFRKMYGGPENVKRGTPVRRRGPRSPSFHYWTWERYDPEFREYRNREIISKGYPAWMVWR